MKVMKRTSEQKSNLHEEHIESVNKMIRQAFGFLYSGDNKVIKVSGGQMSGKIKKIDGLEVILRPTVVGDSGEGKGVIGSLNEDGSEIRIRRGDKWQKKAEKFAGLYEQMSGKESTITVTDEYFTVTDDSP